MNVYDKAKASGCGGKKKYYKKSDAKRHSKRIANRHGGMLKPYHCLFCNYYHLGHKVPQKALFITRDNIDVYKKQAARLEMQADRKAA